MHFTVALTKEITLSVCFLPPSLQFYLQSRFSWRGARLLRPLLQFTLLMMAFYTGLSRVSDHKHHPTDVLAGFVQGALVAYCIVSAHSTCTKHTRHANSKKCDRKQGIRGVLKSITGWYINLGKIKTLKKYEKVWIFFKFKTLYMCCFFRGSSGVGRQRLSGSLMAQLITKSNTLRRRHKEKHTELGKLKSCRKPKHVLNLQSLHKYIFWVLLLFHNTGRMGRW